MRAAWITAVVGGVSLIAMSGRGSVPFMVWNASPSVPIGLYIIEQRQARRGDLALIRLAPEHAELAHQRGYLSASAYLLKPIVATRGDRVCRIGTVVLVRQRVFAVARVTDTAGRLLPAWTGCFVLRSSELFLLAPAAGSFDGRYFGPTGSDRVAGLAKLVWDVFGLLP